ncbi:MAG: hypothetical protein ABI772_00100 [Bacteroidota bacterium]
MNKYQRTAIALTTCLFFITQFIVASGNEPSEKGKIPNLSNYGITAEEFKSLPARVQKKIPSSLMQSDSLLLSIVLMADNNSTDYPKQFEVEGVTGSIIQSKGDVYEVRGADKKLLGMIHKSKDGKKRTVCNADGMVVYNDMGLGGVAWVGVGLGGILVIYGMYFLLYYLFYTDDGSR